MPPVIAAIAAVVSTIGTAVSFVSMVAAEVFEAVGIGYAAAATLGSIVAGVALTAALAGIASLFAPSPQFNVSPILFKADMSAGVPYVIGRTGVGGNIVFVDTSDDPHNTYLHYFTVLSIGPVTAIDSFMANNIPVTFDPDSGQATHLGVNWRGEWEPTTFYNVNDGVDHSGSLFIAVQSGEDEELTNPDFWAPAGTYSGPAWLDLMWQIQSLGLQPDVALRNPAGPDVPEWTDANKLSGLCSTRWVLKADAKAYATGTPAPLWVVRGMPVYDPRLDDTYAGGAGPQRSSDPTTWAFSENPFLHGLTWLLGQKSNGQRIVGLGAPIGAIDVAAFVNGANVADANGWTVGGQCFSTDSKWDVLVAMLQAGCGAPMRMGAMISCMVNQPRVSIATVSGADCSGAVTVQSGVARKDRINSVVPTYRDERHQWQMYALTPITVDSYIAADGGLRQKGINYPFVQATTQAGQLARYAIEDAREFGPITIPLKPQWLGLQPGDCITIDEPEFGLNGQDCLVLDRQIDPTTAAPTLTLRSETGAKHAFALGQTSVAPPPPTLTGMDLTAAAPGSPPWSAIGGTVTAGGVAVPAIIVTGAMENLNATNLIVRTRLSAGPGPWEYYASPPAPVAARTVITGVGSGETRDVGLSYLVRGIQGDELVLAGIVAGASGAGGGSVVLNPVAWTNIVAAGDASATGATNAVALTGITSAVTLTVTFTGAAAIAYSQNAGAWTPILSGGTIVVANGDTLAFQASEGATDAGVITVVNTSNGGAAVGAPTYALTVSGVVPDGTVLFTSDSPGAFAFTVPADAPGFVTIEIWGGGGAGSDGVRRSETNGLGGGGGGYCSAHIAVAPGVTEITGTIGTWGVVDGATAGTDTTVAAPALTAHGGAGGTAIASGAGGTAIGGSADDDGAAGGVSRPWSGGGAGNGGGDQLAAGAVGTVPGGGGAGGFPYETGSGRLTGGAGGNGAPGRVKITGYST